MGDAFSGVLLGMLVAFGLTALAVVVAMCLRAVRAVHDALEWVGESLDLLAAVLDARDGRRTASATSLYGRADDGDDEQ